MKYRNVTNAINGGSSVRWLGVMETFTRFSTHNPNLIRKTTINSKDKYRS